MRKLVATLLLTTLALTAMAQGGIPLLDRVEGHRVQFHYTYSLSQKGSPFKEISDGDVTVEGNAYVLEGLGLKVVSNGSTRWSIDEEAKEMVIETVEKENLFTNPALFIASYRNYLDQIRVNAQGEDSLDVTLTLEDENKAHFVLSGIRFLPQQGKSDFSVDGKSLEKSYVITDLR